MPHSSDHVWFVVCSLLLCLTPAGAATLYVLDCGSHGDRMLSIIQGEGYNGTLHYLCVNLTGCERTDCARPEDVYFQVLANLTESDDTRMSLSFGANVRALSIGIISLLRRGVMIYAADGNDAQASGCYSPAWQPGVIAVSAADSDGALQYNSDGCIDKPLQERLSVSACFTSDATAIAAARGLYANFTRETFCPLKYQWYYMFCMLGLLVLLLLGVAIYCLVTRCIHK